MPSVELPVILLVVGSDQSGCAMMKRARDRGARQPTTWDDVRGAAKVQAGRSLCGRAFGRLFPVHLWSGGRSMAPSRCKNIKAVPSWPTRSPWALVSHLLLGIGKVPWSRI